MRTVEPIELIYQLIGYPHETEWIEFKDSNDDAPHMGQDISALANSAAWLGRDVAYKVWGVRDGDHELIGTEFDPGASKAKGNQDLLMWLKRMLTSNANYEFNRFEYDGRTFVVLAVRAAVEQPVCFQKAAYIREGSNTTLLEPGSAKEAELWRRLQRASFEARFALDGVRATEIADYLDTRLYYDYLQLRYPSSEDVVADELAEQEVVHKKDDGTYAITNLGALLLARRLTDYPGLRKRPIRVLRFIGKGSREILEDVTFDEGYASALARLEEYIMSHVPAEEYSEGVFRRVAYAYPRRAVRELLANMAIHQDLSVSTQGPLVCMYENRIEFSNPGASLVRPERVLNALPVTRNLALVGLLRQMDICEEGGSGWDLAVAACEEAHMLPPRMQSDDELGTRVTLYAGDAFARMTKRERLDALYWHACLRYADGEAMSNQSLRERFGLGDDGKNSLAMSRLIHDGVERGLVKVEDEEAGTRNRRYLPGWA